MQETEFSLKEMLFCALRQWRKIIVWAIIVAVLLGSFVAVDRAIKMNDEDAIEKWKSEYKIKYGTYWAEIYELDRQISANERLASQSQLSIDRLDIQRTNYEGQLEDLDANVIYYEALIEDYNANIENLRLELEELNYYLDYRKEQNEKSLFMDIDPYNVNVYEAYLRVDSGYEILPGNSIQNVDPTPEILETYRLLVSSTSFYDQLINDLKLDTEVRYLTEVITVSVYGVNSLRVQVISDSDVWAKNVGEYVSDTILSNHDHVSQSIKEHDIAEYNTNNFSVVNLEVYTKQQTFLQSEIDLESSIRNTETSILHTESSIRNMKADIRGFHQQIESINLALSELPIKEQELLDKISGYRDANYELQTDRLELMKKPVPKYGGYTPQSVVTGAIKFAIIGGVATVALMAVYFALVGTLRNKVLSSGKLCSVAGSEFFGFWPKATKKSFAFVDRWIDRMYGSSAKGVTAETSADLVLSNVAVACADKKKLLLCGGADKATVDSLAEAIRERLPELELITGGTIGFDPAVVRGMAECDAVVLVEQLDKSDLAAAAQLKDRAQIMGKPILGIVLN